MKIWSRVILFCFGARDFDRWERYPLEYVASFQFCFVILV